MGTYAPPNSPLSATPDDYEGRYVREWVRVFVIALLAALVIRAFCFQAFRIPTESMERSLLVGDYVLVSKLHYGPRSPISLGLPLTDRYVADRELPWFRMPGFSSVARGDVIVFNYPIESKPIDRKTHYIKRVVALPGDTVSIVGKLTYVNSEAFPLQGEMQQQWLAASKQDHPVPVDRLIELGGGNISVLGRDRRRIAFMATPAVAEAVAAWDEIETVEPYLARRTLRPGNSIFSDGGRYERDDFGPIYVPARGDTLILDDATWPSYRTLINRYEHRQAYQRPDGLFEVDGVPTDRYVVRQDYFFVMGDNRDSSSDSRVWGFVPMSHIVGKAVLVYFSWDEQGEGVRQDRLFSRIR